MDVTKGRRLARRLTAAVAAGAIAATAVPAALAGVTPWAGKATSVATACDSQAVANPFTPWGDAGDYVFAPNGGLESGLAGWTTTGAAAVVRGNEPFLVHAASDRSALSLPAGATATTPALCVGFLYPYSRLFVNGPGGATLKVELLFVDPKGGAQAVPVGLVAGSGAWLPSKRLATVGMLIAPLSALSITTGLADRYSAVAFRFTAQGGTWLLDDLYVDPWKLR